MKLKSWYRGKNLFDLFLKKLWGRRIVSSSKMNTRVFCVYCVQLFSLCVHVCVLEDVHHREDIRFNYTYNNFQVSAGLKTIYMLISETAVMTCNKKTSAAPSDLISEHHQSRPLLFGFKPLVSLVAPRGKCFDTFYCQRYKHFCGLSLLCWRYVHVRSTGGLTIRHVAPPTHRGAKHLINISKISVASIII